MTLRQLRDVVEEIYDSKLKFDDKNNHCKLARETMNQYLFTYLNQKYGLKVECALGRVLPSRQPTTS